MTLILILKLIRFSLFSAVSPVSSLQMFFPSSLIKEWTTQPLKLLRKCGDCLAFGISGFSRCWWSLVKICVISAISYLFIIRVIKLFKTVLYVSAACGSFSKTSVCSFTSGPGNVAYNCFTSSSICSIKFSTQSLLWYIFKRLRSSPCANVLYTHHPDSTSYLFSIRSLLFSLILYFVYLLSILLIN